MKEYDVAIVGGGPAGIATALFLAHAQPSVVPRVVVLEKERYPRDKICGGAIGARADHLLANIGVHVDVPSVTVVGMSVRSSRRELCERQETIGRVVRRIEYDHALARAAIARGIEVREASPVEALAIESDAVTLECAGEKLRARLVVGADGMGSIVRRTLGLGAGTLRAQVIELDTEGAPGDRARDVLHFDIADPEFTGYEWDFPTIVGGRPMVCRGVYHLKLDERKVDIKARLSDRLERVGLDFSRYTQKRFAERGFDPHEAYASDRAILVGEAAGIDALTGEGIAQAIEYAAFAGPYIAEKLAAREFSFRDWADRFKRTKVGFDLRLRHGLLPYYFGKHRSWFETYFMMRPEILACSLEQFAGRPVSNMRALRALPSALWEIASDAWKRVRS